MRPQPTLVPLPQETVTARPHWQWPARERCQTNPNRRDVLREHRAARDPRSSPATVSLPSRGCTTADKRYPVITPANRLRGQDLVSAPATWSTPLGERQ